MLEVILDKEKIVVKNFKEKEPFSLKETLECGQCFRFDAISSKRYRGVVKGYLLDIEEENQDLIFHNTSEKIFENVSRPYFDLDRKYGEIQKTLEKNPVMRKAISYAPGIRILQQETWETLCTFLFSQNNNIKRIKGIVDRFCTLFGDPIDSEQFAFPTVEQVVHRDITEINLLRAGFRGKYILDAAKKVWTKEIELSCLSTLPLEEAEIYLQQIMGVGPKVADCVLLFGGGHLDAFPKDVWILRAMKELFPKGLPNYMKPYAGIAQQYLFHYIRNSPECEPLRKQKSTS